MRLLKFDGKARNFFFVGLAAFLLTILTLGLAFPWATTMLIRWRTDHTIVEGRRLRFRGTGSGLFGKWILWWVFTILTLGLYSLIVWPRYQRWIVENTAIEDNRPEYLNDGKFEDDPIGDETV